jgi:hypothetical protein
LPGKETEGESIVRKALLIIAFAAAFVVPASASATRPPIICGGACDGGGGGWTGCTQQSESHSGNLTPIANVRHYLVVSYCKVRGTITSISIAAHGCDVGGLVSCSVGPAWQTGGGVGAGYATFEAHATWMVTLPPFYNNYDTLHLTVPVG